MKESDLLDIVEGAYDLEVDGQEWLVRANDRFASRFQGVTACGGYVVSKTPEGPPTFHAAYLTGIEDAMTVFGPMHEDMDPVLAEAVFPFGTQRDR